MDQTKEKKEHEEYKEYSNINFRNMNTNLDQIS